MSEFLMYLDVAVGWSLATAFTMSTGIMTFVVVAAVVIAVLVIAYAVVTQRKEESSYRTAHGIAR